MVQQARSLDAMDIDTPCEAPQPQGPLLLPSILSAPFATLGASLASLESAGARVFHYDVMDGHFVPNLSIGPVLIDSLIRCGVRTQFDVHLMVTNPELQMKWFNLSTVRSISIHNEASQDIKRDLTWIRDQGKRGGVAINPPTSVEALEHILDIVDQVLVMSVYPGFAGQPFLEESLPKIESLAERREKRGYRYSIQVDGGINPQTIQSVLNAGADEIVSGSTIFDDKDPPTAFQRLDQLMSSYSNRKI